MDKIELHYAPPRELCDPKLLEGDEPITKKEAIELLKIAIGLPLSLSLLVGPLIGVGIYIQEVEYGGFEGLESPEASKKQTKKKKPAKIQKECRVPRASLSKEKLPLPKAFLKRPLPKEAFKPKNLRRIPRVQHF